VIGLQISTTAALHSIEPWLIINDAEGRDAHTCVWTFLGYLSAKSIGLSKTFQNLQFFFSSHGTVFCHSLPYRCCAFGTQPVVALDFASLPLSHPKAGTRSNRESANRPILFSDSLEIWESGNRFFCGYSSGTGTDPYPGNISQITRESEGTGRNRQESVGIGRNRQEMSGHHYIPQNLPPPPTHTHTWEPPLTSGRPFFCGRGGDGPGWANTPYPSRHLIQTYRRIDQTREVSR
jgi:hypothetical protein